MPDPVAGDRIFASDFRAGKVVGYARRITSSASATITTETSYLRVDTVRMFAGRGYLIVTSPINAKGSVSGDVSDVRLRVSNAGAATTASSQISHVRTADVISTTQTPLTPLTAYYPCPADTTTFSALFTIARAVAGAGSTGVQWVASGTETFDVMIIDAGFTVTDTGVSL